MYPLYLWEITGLQCASNSFMPHCLFLVIIVACLGGSIIEQNNSYDVKEVLLSITLELIAGTNPNCKVQLPLLPSILLHKTAYFLWTYARVIQLVPGWAHIPCAQQ